MKSVIEGFRGALSFLTRIPVNTDRGDWEQFRTFPAAFVLVGYLIGAIAALPFALGLPAPTAAFGYLFVLVALVGIPHLDGVADLGDAMAAHGEEATRKALKDTKTGVGAIVATTVVVIGLVLAAVALSGLPLTVAVGIVIAAEIGAKLGMASIACLGSAAHDGMGSAFTGSVDRAQMLGPILVALPAALLVSVPVGLVAVGLGPIVAIGLIRWASDAIGGVNGDIFGATNEIARVLSLHAGVIVWTLW